MTTQSAARWASICRVVIAASLLAIVVLEYVVPLLADQHYRENYRKLAADCDLAMHDEAALRVGTAGAIKHPALVTSAAIGLTVCHEYDKLRKRLLILGVTEERLALHGLEALEIEQIPVQRMVEPHRMDRF
jgi:hypothetical protein